jgi:hypothetical protein
MRRLACLGLGLVLALASPLLADNTRTPADVARGLADGKLDPASAIEAWGAAGVTPVTAFDFMLGHFEAPAKYSQAPISGSSAEFVGSIGQGRHGVPVLCVRHVSA